MNPKIIGNCTMAIVATLFGINFTATKLILDSQAVSPYSLMLFRLLFGTAAFWIASLFIPREHIHRADIKWIIIASALGIIFNQGIFIIGIKHTSPIDASIITTIVPIITMIVSYIYLREPLSKMKVAGVTLGAIGAISLIILTKQGLSGEGASFIGNMLIVCSSLAYSCFFVFSRGISQKYSSITIMKWMFLIASLALLPFFFKSIPASPIFHEPFNWQSFGPLLFILIGATFLPYLLLPIAQRFIRPTTMSMYNYVQPIVASLLGIWLGQGVLTLPKALCALLIFSGVFLVSRSKSKV